MTPESRLMASPQHPSSFFPLRKVSWRLKGRRTLSEFQVHIQYRCILATCLTKVNSCMQQYIQFNLGGRRCSFTAKTQSLSSSIRLLPCILSKKHSNYVCRDVNHTTFDQAVMPDAEQHTDVEGFSKPLKCMCFSEGVRSNSAMSL